MSNGESAGNFTLKSGRLLYPEECIIVSQTVNMKLNGKFKGAGPTISINFIK